MKNEHGAYFSERGRKASSKVGRLKALFKRRKVDEGLFHLEEREGMDYVVPNHDPVDYEVPTVLRRNPGFQVINRI